MILFGTIFLNIKNVKKKQEQPAQLQSEVSSFLRKDVIERLVSPRFSAPGTAEKAASSSF